MLRVSPASCLGSSCGSMSCLDLADVKRVLPPSQKQWFGLETCLSCKVKVDAKGRVPLVQGFIFLGFLEAEEGAGLAHPKVIQN